MSDSCNPVDCSPPSFSVHGIFQARILEWIDISFSRGSSQPRDWTQISPIVDRRFTIWATREVLFTDYTTLKKFLYFCLLQFSHLLMESTSNLYQNVDMKLKWVNFELALRAIISYYYRDLLCKSSSNFFAQLFTLFSGQWPPSLSRLLILYWHVLKYIGLPSFIMRSSRQGIDS